MDGGWWACLGGIDRHLFVNESHSQINYVGTLPEFWSQHEGSD